MTATFNKIILHCFENKLPSIGQVANGHAFMLSCQECSNSCQQQKICWLSYTKPSL